MPSIVSNATQYEHITNISDFLDTSRKDHKEGVGERDMDAAMEEKNVEQMIIELENGAGGEGGITFMEKSPRTPTQSTTPSTEKSPTPTAPAPSTPRTPRPATAPPAVSESENANNGKEEVHVQVPQDIFPQIPPAQPNQVATYQQDLAYPSLQNLVEFRYDMMGSAHIIDNVAQFLGDSYAHFANSPQSPQVFSVLESVCHYYSQPCCIYICGEWVSSQIQIPVAQHICVSVDDGTKRYEEVIKLDLTRIPPSLESQQLIFTSVEHRIVRGNPSRRPRFRDILRRSLEETMRTLTDTSFEIIVSRATGRCGSMDYLISQFFADPHPGSPYELFVGPLIQHVPQQLDIGLTGARYKVCGFFQRPVLGNATILLTRGDTQLFETLSINIFGHERKILGVAFDSAVARLVGSGESSSCAIALVEAASYSDFGPTGWGLNVVSHNPRVAPAFHPFCNLQQNPLFNRNLNPYYSLSFHPPSLHASLGYSQAPYGFYACPLVGGQLLQAQPLLPMLTLPGTVAVTGIQIVPPGEQTPEKSQTDESTDRDDRSRSVSPRRREKKPVKRTKQASGKEAMAKLNPHAREYYPQGYGTHGNRFTVRSGPEEISVNELQTDSEDTVYISSVVKCTPIPAAKREELQICSTKLSEKPSANSDISMYVSRSPFPNQSESRCSVLDPENTLEVKTSRFKMQDMSVPPFRSTSWSEDMENHSYVEETEPKHRFSESYDSGRGRRQFRDANYRGNDDWSVKNRNGNNRWSGGGRRQDNGQSNEYRQDLRASHGFGPRDSHNGPRYLRGSNNERISWGRGGRNNNNSYGDRYYQRDPREYDQDTSRRANPDFNEPESKLLDESNVPGGSSSRPNQISLLEPSNVTNHRRSPSDEEKATSSYAAAARVNVSADLHAFTAPRNPENESEQIPEIPTPASGGDSKEEEVYNFSNANRGHNRGNYQSNYRGNYRTYRRDYNYDYNNSYYSNDNHGGYQNQYYEQRNYNRRAYLNYPKRNQDNWNNNNTSNNKGNMETEEVQQQPNPPQKWNKYPTKNFQPNNRSQNPKRGGSTRGGHQDVPSLNDFPPLYTAATSAPAAKVAPVKEPKPKSAGGSSNIKKKAKCFKKYNNREGSTSSEDVDNYLGDVIPREIKPATVPEEENDSRKDARGDGLFQADSTENEKAVETQPQNAETVEDHVENSRKETADPRFSLGYGTAVDHSSLTEYDADIEGGGEPRD